MTGGFGKLATHETAGANLQDRVALRLVVDPPTGNVLRVTVASGHALLRASATEAAKQWQFGPSKANAESIDAVLDYAIRCPGNPPLIPTAVH